MYLYTILCWSTDCPCSSLLFIKWPLTVPLAINYFYMAHEQSLSLSTILYWPTDSPYSSLLFCTGPVTVSVALYYSLLAQ